VNFPRRPERGQSHVAGCPVKGAWRPKQRKELVGHLIDRCRIGVRRACEVVRQSRSTWYYQRRENDGAPLLRRTEEIAARAPTDVDNFTKESLVIEVDQQLKGEEVVAVMERLRHQRDSPQRIQADNGNGSPGLRPRRDHRLFLSRKAYQQLVHRVVQR